MVVHFPGEEKKKTYPLDRPKNIYRKQRIHMQITKKKSRKEKKSIVKKKEINFDHIWRRSQTGFYSI